MNGARGQAVHHRACSTVLRCTAVVALLLASACGGDPAAAAPQRAPLSVFAASSLTAAFEALAEAFEQSHPDTDVELHFAGTPQLLLQLREGAVADVFASADEANMQKATAAGLTAGAPTPFASNGLAICTAPDNPKALRGLIDLARDDLVVVLCGPEVPAGRYARQALGKAGVTVRSASDEPNVKAVVAKVQLGEADAGIVYRTDTAAARGQVGEVAVAAEHDVRATYPIVRLTSARAAERADRFVDFVRSPAGRAVLERFGFGAP